MPGQSSLCRSTSRRSANVDGIELDPAQRSDLVQGITSRRTFAAGLGAAAITAPALLRSSRALAAPAKVSFCLPWIPHGGYAFLFAASKLGFWAIARSRFKSIGAS